jgi:translation initiation factor 2 subunit 1
MASAPPDPPSTGETAVYRRSTDTDEKTKCRFYERQFPDVDELVMVNVRNVETLGAYVTLLEYNNIEGMVLLSELSRRRIRSIAKLIRVGRQEVVMVMRVDKEKGYVDLSKRRVPAEDVPKFNAQFAKSKAVHSIVRHVAMTTDYMLEDIYTNVVWPLYKEFGHAHDAFKFSISDEARVFGRFRAAGMPDEIFDAMMVSIRRKLAKTALKLRADVEVECFNEEGIDAIKGALLAGRECGTEDSPINIQLIAPPKYVLFVTSMDRTQGIDILQRALDTIEATIKGSGGVFHLKVAPHATNVDEESELLAEFETLAKANAEVDGDAAEDAPAFASSDAK